MTLHLLDADAIIDYTWSVTPTVSLIDSLTLAGHPLCVSDIVVTEVYSGLNPSRTTAAETLLAACHFLPTSLDR